MDIALLLIVSEGRNFCAFALSSWECRLHLGPTRHGVAIVDASLPARGRVIRRPFSMHFLAFFSIIIPILISAPSWVSVVLPATPAHRSSTHPIRLMCGSGASLRVYWPPDRCPNPAKTLFTSPSSLSNMKVGELLVSHFMRLMKHLRNGREYGACCLITWNSLSIGEISSVAYKNVVGARCTSWRLAQLCSCMCFVLNPY